MGRAKLRLELLSTEKGRRKAYEIRRKGLKKKAEELSTLCGVDLCMIMYPPPLKNEEIEPLVWSNDPGQVANLIEFHKLSRLGDEYSKSRTYDLSTFYEDQTRKIKEEAEKLRKKNREAKYPNWDERYNHFSLEELKNLTGVLTEKINAAKAWSNFLKERKVDVTESNISTNQGTQENLGSSMLGMVDGRFEQYFDAEYYNLEYQRRTLAAMAMNIGTSCLVNNATFNYTENGIVDVDPMSYNVETMPDHPEPQHIGQGLMMNNPASYYFPPMDAAYGEDYSRMAQHIGQGLMMNNPASYYFLQMDAAYGEDYGRMAQHIGQGLMMNNPAADYFLQMDAAYGEDYGRMAQHFGQGLLANNPTDYNFPKMDASYGEDCFKIWNF